MTTTSNAAAASDGGARTTITRRIAWVDTDAAGVWHWLTAFRLAEQAEAELHRELGITDRTFGWTPRVRVEADFAAALRFDDEVTCELVVERVGRASITYGFAINRRADGEVAATGRVVSVLVDAPAGRGQAVDDEMRRALETGEPVA